MKLHYYDETTPADYEPPMFRSGTMDEALFYFSSDPTKMKIGKVDSGHHAIDVKMYSSVENEESEGEEEEDIMTVKETVVSKGVQDKVRQETYKEEIKQQEANEEEESSESDSNDTMTEKEEIECACGDEDADLGMVSNQLSNDTHLSHPDSM